MLKALFDGEKAFDDLPFPDENDKVAVKEYIEKFEEEFGEDYRLSNWVDPSNDWEENEDGTLSVINYDPVYEKMERIKRRKELKDTYSKAIAENNRKVKNSLDDLRYSDNEEDDEWNMTAYLDKTHR